MISVEQIQQLPLTYSLTIPNDYIDDMGHMNVQYYMHCFDKSTWKMFGMLGLTLEYLETNNAGMFALKQFVCYLAEVRVGETVELYTRLLGASAKRLHFLHFIVNQTTGVLSSTAENVGSHVDMQARRTAPFPPKVAAAVLALADEHAALDWQATTCGILYP